MPTSVVIAVAALTVSTVTSFMQMQQAQDAADAAIQRENAKAAKATKLANEKAVLDRQEVDAELKRKKELLDIQKRELAGRALAKVGSANFGVGSSISRGLQSSINQTRQNEITFAEEVAGRTIASINAGTKASIFNIDSIRASNVADFRNQANQAELSFAGTAANNAFSAASLFIPAPTKTKTTEG